MKRALFAAVLFVHASIALAVDTREQIVGEYAALKTQAGSLTASQQLAKVFDLDWRYSMLTSPEWATSVGYPGYDDRWTDQSEAAIAIRKKDVSLPLEAIRAIDRSQLSKTEQLYYDLYLRNLNLTLEYQKFPSELMPINQMGGVQQDAPQMIEQMPHTTVAHFETIISRLRNLPALVDQDIALMRRGVTAGIVPPKIILRDVPEQIDNIIPAGTGASPLLRLFQQLPESFSPADRERLRGTAEQVFREQVEPAFSRLHDYVQKEYLPAARDSIAWSALPNGHEWYALNVRYHTTTNLTPKEIHEIGLREVDRIQHEMEALVASTGFKGNSEDFVKFLRTDPQFYFTSDADLLRTYRDISKRIDPELGRLFGKLPRTPYGIRPVPSYAQKSQSTAYYESGSVRTGRPGYFYANTYDLSARPKWEMEALTLHEAVPGHHLQIALAQELENVPEWRRYDGYTAYTEGWGLYSESLGREIGLYEDPYQKFGALSFEMWRACRLVVDTGMHELGWSRQQAIDFMMKYSGKTEHNVIVEVDRYIVWPGQALAYKIGQLKITGLRQRAATKLGAKFDLRAFHDLILSQGAVPLDLLEKMVDEWIATQLKS